MHWVSFACIQGDMWWQTESRQGQCPPTWHQFKTWIVMKYCKFCGSNTQWFHVELLQVNDAKPQRYPQWLIFLIMNLVINLYRKKLIRMEIDKVKKIVFSKLWEYDTYCKIGSVCLQNKRFGRVCLNKEWGNCEKNLQRLKFIFNFNSLRKRLILFNQSSKRGHYWKIVGNEM
jgi:hypothetical protein